MTEYEEKAMEELAGWQKKMKNSPGALRRHPKKNSKPDQPDDPGKNSHRIYDGDKTNDTCRYFWFWIYNGQSHWQRQPWKNGK